MAEKSHEKEIRISFCPSCKSRNVGYTFEFGNLFGIIPKMRCFDCNFSAVSFPVLVTTKEKLEKSVKNKKMKRKKK